MHIGFSLGREFVSKFIKWITKSKASHAFMCLDIAGEEVILHSDQHNVNCALLEKFEKDNDVKYEFELLISEEEEKKILSYAIRKLHRPYDYLAAIGFLWVLICKAFGKQVKNPMPNRSAYFCSELVVMSLRQINFPGIEQFDRELTSPEDLIRFLKEHPKAKLIREA